MSSADPMTHWEGCERAHHACALAQLDALRTRLAQMETDIRDAAGELRVEMPQPGTVTAKLLSANVLLRRERDAARRWRDEAVAACAQRGCASRERRLTEAVVERDAAQAREQELVGIIDTIARMVSFTGNHSDGDALLAKVAATLARAEQAEAERDEARRDLRIITDDWNTIERGREQAEAQRDAAVAVLAAARPALGALEAMVAMLRNDDFSMCNSAVVVEAMTRLRAALDALAAAQETR